MTSNNGITRENGRGQRFLVDKRPKQGKVTKTAAEWQKRLTLFKSRFLRRKKG